LAFAIVENRILFLLVTAGLQLRTVAGDRPAAEHGNGLRYTSKSLSAIGNGFHPLTSGQRGILRQISPLKAIHIIASSERTNLPLLKWCDEGWLSFRL